jgi:hypothetical protein
MNQFSQKPMKDSDVRPHARIVFVAMSIIASVFLIFIFSVFLIRNFQPAMYVRYSPFSSDVLTVGMRWCPLVTLHPGNAGYSDATDVYQAFEQRIRSNGGADYSCYVYISKFSKNPERREFALSALRTIEQINNERKGRGEIGPGGEVK